MCDQAVNVDISHPPALRRITRPSGCGQRLITNHWFDRSDKT
jgi:hypothetical protein